MRDAIGMSTSTVVLSGRPVPMDLTFKRYDAIRPFIAEGGRYFIELRKSLTALRDRASLTGQPCNTLNASSSSSPVRNLGHLRAPWWTDRGWTRASIF